MSMTDPAAFPLMPPAVMVIATLVIKRPVIPPKASTRTIGNAAVVVQESKHTDPPVMAVVPAKVGLTCNPILVMLIDLTDTVVPEVKALAKTAVPIEIAVDPFTI